MLSVCVNEDPMATVGDNSLYHDDNTAQRLKTKDITELKMKGASGHEIIRSLIQNSDTWENKSQFAREKWLARKQKRYPDELSVLPYIVMRCIYVPKIRETSAHCEVHSGYSCRCVPHEEQGQDMVL